jgi:methyl-accepting chemotaxis protein
MVEEATAAARTLAGEADALARMIEHYRIGRSADDSLRRELKRVAPHAFPDAPAKPAPAKPAAKAKTPERPTTSASRRPPVKAVAASRAPKAANENWEEF